MSYDIHPAGPSTTFDGYGADDPDDVLVPETPETTTEVPAELIKPAAEVLLRDYDSQYDAPHLSWKDFTGQARDILAAVLPAARRQWFAELFGTPEEIRQREIEAKANAKPDDPIELCERIRPGLHEQRVRAKVAAEARDTAARLDEGPYATSLYRFAERLTARGEQS